MNNKQKVGGIFCDLHKAFDCVQHKILLDKLKFHGIDGKFGTLIESYITNRYQKVSLEKGDHNKNSSEWAKIHCGISQGSILGPLFFLTFIRRTHQILLNWLRTNAPNRLPFKCPAHSCRCLEL